MLSLVKGFFKDEEGMGTVEVVLILAVLVTIALIFKNTVTKWVNKMMGDIFETKVDITDVDTGLKQDTQ